MDREPKGKGAVAALLIAVPIALVLAWSQPTRGPSRAELADALSRDARQAVRASEVRSISCAEQAAGYECRWEQQVDDVWGPRAGHVVTGTDGWQLVKD